MARYNEILVGRLNRFLQKYLSMKGDAPSPQLASDWTPTINFDAGVELRYLQGWNRFGLWINQIAVAANQSGIRLRNPVGSNIIAVVEKLVINFQSTTSMQMSHGTATADLATVYSQNTRFDPRGGQMAGLAFSSQASAVTLPGLGGTSVMWAAYSTANTNIELIVDSDQQVPILPGDAIQLADGTANDALFASIWWRERFLEESERT